MRALRALSQDPEQPLDCLQLVEIDAPVERPGWTAVRVRAGSVNMHDVWTLRGVGHPADRIPITLGCDVAGVTRDGREVIVHPVFGDPAAGGGDVTFDPGRHLLSERLDGGFADEVLVPTDSLVDKPEWLSWEQAAALPVAWGTAYRMLFTRAQIKAGDRVLVQGASGGVASAAISLAAGAGATVYATARTPEKRDLALQLGAKEAFESGARLPERVDAVIETVGEATWRHSLRALRPGGTIVISGATSGDMPAAELSRVFYLQLNILGSTGCTRPEMEALLQFLGDTGVRPLIDSVVPMSDYRQAFERVIAGQITGKVIIVPDDQA
ncbi:MAG: zinc-binding dehydrogenase [Propionibacteriaceae bacterium]|nr:zinc-binding dehydrogenase [Propionibacteriaceae bacterium]